MRTFALPAHGDLTHALVDWRVDPRKSALFVTRTGEQFTLVLRHTWATNFMQAPNASLLERQGGWAEQAIPA